MERIRVVHVIDNLFPGGTERQCVELVRGLAGIGIQNAVFYFKPGPLLTVLEQAGVIVRALPQGSLRSARSVLRLIKLARAIRRWDPSVVQTYGVYSNLRGLLAGFFAGVPVRVAGRRDLGESLRPIQHRADRWAWKLAHRIVANSEAVRQQLISQEQVPPDKVVVIRNGVNLRDWPLPDHPVDGNGDAVVGMIAHFREGKGHVTFLRAASEILKVIPSVRFCLVGSGPLEPMIRECAYELGIADQVEFWGHMEGEALRSALRQFRVSVLTSKSEGLPNVVLESMAAGRPVVATAVGGTLEIIEDSVTGFLVPAEDPVTMAERLVCLLKKPSLAWAMGKQGRQKVEREFTLERMVDQFQRLYRDLYRAKRGWDH
jgi:glycosyltransferase involved in cell wall biosynthesis